MDHLDFGPLTDLVIETVLDEEQISYLACECLHAIEYLHGKKIIHRDIKSDNFYLNMNGRVKLVDLGFSVGMTDDLNKRFTLAGTPCWMAPEVIKKVDYNEKVDIWSFGILLIEMIDGEPPYIEQGVIEIMKSILENGQPKLKSDLSLFSDDIIDVLNKCLQIEYSKRPNARELLDHDFFANKVINDASFSPSNLLKPNIDAVLNMREEIYL
jgi:serine/threonine protein kinase